MKILIVEDEKELSQSMSDYLSSEQFVCEQAFTYGTALEKIEIFEYACIILDINLPDGNGLKLLRIMKDDKKLDGVIIVSARDSVSDKVEGLRMGADDYLTKPFHLSELSARVEAIIRRKSFNGQNKFVVGPFEIDLLQKNVKVNGEIIELTPKEYKLFLYFISNKNKVITKNAISNHLWGDDMDMAGNFDHIYTHIKNLRKKLLSSGVEDYITSVYGMGYRFLLT
jgi:DNA-binding response OmpR family regulator